MRIRIAIFLVILTAVYSCKKTDSGGTGDLPTIEKNVLSNFTDNIARAEYNSMASKADYLYSDLITLQSLTTDANLTRARVAWQDLRSVWERSEGFLLGPVKDSNYDGIMDTWPTDPVQMDSLLGSSVQLSLQTIQNLPLSLRGFHPIEYILFGAHGDRKPAALSQRQMDYVVSLAEDLKNNCHALADAWDPNKGNYGSLLINAGPGNPKYLAKKAAYLAMVDGLRNICSEVADYKMQMPLQSEDATKVESPYSGSSVADFQNNILGLQSVYLGHYNQDGTGLKDLVANFDASLDTKLQSQMSAAILSFSSITHYYEQAIFDQQTQIHQTQALLGTLKTSLDSDLRPLIVNNIKD